jgi:hypothetical protein
MVQKHYFTGMLLVHNLWTCVTDVFLSRSLNVMLYKEAVNSGEDPYSIGSKCVNSLGYPIPLLIRSSTTKRILPHDVVPRVQVLTYYASPN